MTPEIRDELERYPLTGRFLMGRLRGDMSLEEREQLESLICQTEQVNDGEYVIRAGETSDVSTILIQGFMVRSLVKNGQRHAVSFHVPGDFVDLHCFALKKLDHNVECIGPVRYGHVRHRDISRIMQTMPHLARLFWFQTLLDAALHREKIVKLEQLTVPRRIAHLFAEIWRRLEMVGLAFPDGFATPMTQVDIADLCGATAVHTNRAVAELRNSGIADLKRGEVRVADRSALESYGHFEGDYLYGEGSLKLRGFDMYTPPEPAGRLPRRPIEKGR